MQSWPIRLVSRESAHQHMDPGLLACAVIIALLAIAVVVLRFYARWWLVKKARPEDWCILASLFMAVGTSISVGRREYFSVPALENC